MKIYFGLIIICCFGLINCQTQDSIDYSQWTSYGGTKDGARYSTLDQVNVSNVATLTKAWEYNTGDGTEKSQIQCQPIVIDGVLFATSPQVKVLALNAATGEEKWVFDPYEILGGQNSWAGTNRGVTYWAEGEDKRILFTAGNWLICLDADTGEVISSFGEGGKVDLQKDLDYHRDEFLIVSNSPGVIYKDKLIMGMRLSEGLDAAPGHVRAYNVITGKKEWIFHTIPHPGEKGYETWEKDSWKQVGAANNWAGMALDEKREIVYVPTGSASYDFWGVYRHGDNLFANCILALDANTGERIWHYQVIHHDVWDRDFPANPTLATIQKDGNSIDVIAQISKQGFVYLLNRETGEPIFPIEEVEVPQSDLPGEKTSPTQPVPSLPEPFMRQVFDKNEINDLSDQYKEDILKQIEGVKMGNMWNPPSLEGTLHFPGMDGGGEWGGASFDQETGHLIVNANEMPWIIKMTKNPKYDNLGQKIYANNCGNCHGLNLKGTPPAIPSLIGLGDKYSYNEVFSIVTNGKGAMPAFRYIESTDREMLVRFLLGMKDESDGKKELEGEGAVKTPEYVMTGYKRLLTEDGYPGIKPPWGTLNAIDLSTGKVVWKSVLGEHKELTAKGIAPTGTENYGGPVTTTGGLIFIAATKDEKIRAFDKKTGKVLWEAPLPASGHATPAVYEVDGQQYITIACGGGKGTKSGDSYVSFTLPKD